MPVTSTANLKKGSQTVLGAYRGATPAYNARTFYRDFAQLKSLNHGIGPAITFTRASNATYFDVNGVLQTASNDAPRFDHDPATGASRGLLIEEARTNSIRNSQAGGAVAGTPGTLPTNWINATLPSGISREVVASGTANGFNYVDLKFSGTSTASGFIQIYPESLTQVVASSGQSWTGSLYLALVNGSTSGITDPRINVVERDSGGTSLAASNLTVTLSGTLARYALTGTLNNASTTRVSVQFNGSIASGVTIDITLRIAAPQLEQGAFPTSYIPTTNAAATRSADSAVVTPISSFYNPVESTILSELSVFSVASDSTILAINNTTQNEQIDQRSAISSINSRTRVGGVNQAALNPFSPSVAPVSGTIYKFASAHKQDDFAVSQDGSTAQTDTAGNMPSGLIRMEIGRRDGSGFLTGHIRKIAYYPKRLSNTLLQQLTT